MTEDKQSELMTNINLITMIERKKSYDTVFAFSNEKEQEFLLTIKEMTSEERQVEKKRLVELLNAS